MVRFSFLSNNEGGEAAVHPPSRTNRLSQLSGISQATTLRDEEDVEKQIAGLEGRAALPQHHGTTTAGCRTPLGCQGLVEKPVGTLPDLTFPEGGLSAWLVVAGAFCTMLCVFGFINSSAVLESYFSAHQLSHYTPSQRGWVFSLNLFCVFFLGLQVGPVFDRFGPRALVAVGSVLVVGSFFLLGVCKTYSQIILVYSIMGGSGGALLLSPGYGCIAHFFDERRALATGVATTAGGVGGVLFPLVLQKVLPELGFRWATRVMALILLAVTVPANLLLRSRLPARTSQARGYFLPDFAIFMDPRYAFAVLGTFFTECGLFIPVTFIVSYAAAHGQDNAKAYTLLSILNASSVAGRCLPGLLADRLGCFNVIIVTIALCMASTLGIWLHASSSRPTLSAFPAVFGFASGSSLSLAPVCLGKLCDARSYGRFLSVANFIASFGSLISVPIGGALLGTDPAAPDGSREAGWKALILFSGCSYGTALLCYLASRVLSVGWSLRTKF